MQTCFGRQALVVHLWTRWALAPLPAMLIYGSRLLSLAAYSCWPHPARSHPLKEEFQCKCHCYPLPREVWWKYLNGSVLTCILFGPWISSCLYTHRSHKVLSFCGFLSFLLQGASSRPEHDLDAKDYLPKCKYYHITPLLKSPLKQIIKQRVSERNLRGSRPCQVSPSLLPYFISFCPIESTTKILRFNCFGGSSSPYEGSHVISLWKIYTK